MRKILYINIIVAVFFAPVDRLDIAKLLPVEAVAVYRENDTVVLKTDTDNTGRGKTVWEALKNLKENAVSVIYLDTADYLLIGTPRMSLRNCSRYCDGQYTQGLIAVVMLRPRQSIWIPTKTPLHRQAKKLKKSKKDA